MESETKMEFKTFYLLRDNAGEREFTKERILFDLYDLSEIMGETEAEQLLDKICEKLSLKRDGEYYLTSVTLNMGELDKELESLSEQILEAFESLGADDDTFDYFPDFVRAFQQICEQTNKKYFFNELIKILNEEEYNDIGEPFVAI